jgi:hypothetical protein
MRTGWPQRLCNNVSYFAVGLCRNSWHLRQPIAMSNYKMPVAVDVAIANAYRLYTFASRLTSRRAHPHGIV